MSLGEPALVTCLANDLGYEHALSEQVATYGRHGDLLILLSVSGCSENVLRAAKMADLLGLKIWAMTGDLGELDALTKNIVHVPSAAAGPVETVHLGYVHYIVEEIRQRIAADPRSR